ncbi:MAG: hypothetical protein H0W60_03395 [Chloroflexi bacterium]|jgi:hypothetical protein|nr:hypothetical protein [Chloroflexota bacterium]MBA3626766.1 hypothetical protein [Chloroflexota bacterium]MBA3796853.1 hypothetical protein [Chloroflexota bacterium]
MVFAYLDAASGSLIIQALIAGLVAVPIFFRAQLSKGMHAVRRVLRREPKSSQRSD